MRVVKVQNREEEHLKWFLECFSSSYLVLLPTSALNIKEALLLKLQTSVHAFCILDFYLFGDLPYYSDHALCFFFNQSLLNEFKFQYMVSEVGIQWRLSAHAFRDTYIFSRKLNVCLCLHCTKLCPWKYTWALSGGICISWHRDCDWERYWKTEGLQIMIDIGAEIKGMQRSR